MSGATGGESSAFSGIGGLGSASYSHGGASISVPIQVPNARLLTTPELFLSYSSDGGHGPFGLGWNLPTGSISRSTRQGVPRCPAGDSRSFVLEMSGASNHLVEVLNGTGAGTGVFHMEVDLAYTEAFVDEDGNSWTVRSRDGLVYTFGGIDGSRVHSGVDVYRSVTGNGCDWTVAWYLTRIEDPNGNHVDYAYDDSGNMPVVSSISYGGHDTAGILHPYQVRFEFEDMALDVGKPARVSYSLGVRQVLDKRVSGIAVELRAESGWEPIRHYALEYDDSRASHIFLLESFGQDDGVDPNDRQPTQTFDYSSDVATTGESYVDTGVVGGVLGVEDTQGTVGTLERYIDADGDGRFDRVQAGYNDPNSWTVYYYGEETVLNNWSLPSGALQGGFKGRVRYEAHFSSSKHTLNDALDVNGDGIMDLVHYNSANGTIDIYRGECTAYHQCGFQDEPLEWVNPGNEPFERRENTYFQTHFFIDMNADGRLDLVRGPAGTDLTVYYNNGDGFDAGIELENTIERQWMWDYWTVTEGLSPSAAEQQLADDPWPYERTFLDVNGDGLPDQLHFGGIVIGNHWHIDGWPFYYNFEADGSLDGPYRANGMFPSSPPFTPTGASLSATFVALNTGNGFADAVMTPTPFRTGELRFVENDQSNYDDGHFYDYSKQDVVDVNADGLPDIVETIWGDWRATLSLGDGKFSTDMELRAVEFQDPTMQWPGEATSVHVIGDVEYHLRRVEVNHNQHKSYIRDDVLDWDADGLPDIVRSNSPSDQHTGDRTITPLRFETGDGYSTKPNLLIRATNGLGGVTHLRYAPSSRFEHRDPDTGAPSMPFIKWVVTDIRRTDGLCRIEPTDLDLLDDEPADWLDPQANPCLASGNEIVERIEYSGGYYDADDREFRGFRQVRVTDGAHNASVLTFHQTKELQGQLHKVEIFAGGDATLKQSQTDYLWQLYTSPESPDRTQVYLQEKKERTFSLLTADTPGAGLSSAAQCMVHRNSVSDPTGVFNAGQPDPYTRVWRSCTLPCGDGGPSIPDAADECATPVELQRTSNTLWATPLGASTTPVWERPHTMYSSYRPEGSPAGSNSLTSITQFEYDGDVGAALASGQVSRGNLRVETTWSSVSGIAPQTRIEYAYDNDDVPNPGNRISVQNLTQGTGKAESIFDSDYRIFVEEHRSVPFTLADGTVSRHVSKHQYDMKLGVVHTRFGLHGEENGDVTTQTFDNLGRQVCSAGPGESCDESGGIAWRTKTLYFYGNPDAEDFLGRLNYTETRRREPRATAHGGYLVNRQYYDGLGRKRIVTNQQFTIPSTSSGGAAATPSMMTVVMQHHTYTPTGQIFRNYDTYTLGASEVLEAEPTSQTARMEYAYALNGAGLSGGSLIIDPKARVHRTRRTDGTTVWSESLSYFSAVEARHIDAEGHHETELRDLYGRTLEHRVFEGASDLEALKEFEYGHSEQPLIEIYGGDESTAITRNLDFLGRVTSQSDPDSGTWTSLYDAAGNVVYANDPETGQRVQTCFDEINRPILRCGITSGDEYDATICASADPVCPSGSIEYSFEYDHFDPAAGEFGLGRLYSVDGPENSVVTTFDVRGRTTTEVSTVAGIEATTSFAYDSVDRPRRVTYPDGETIAYFYDEGGQPKSMWGVDPVTGALGLRFVQDIVYDHRGTVTAMWRGLGNLVDEYSRHGPEYQWEQRSHVVRNSSTHLDLEYVSYDRNGRLTQVDDNRWEEASSLSQKARYEYDGAGRLTDVVGTAADGSFNESFAYDDIGNITGIGFGQQAATARNDLVYSPTAPHQLDYMERPDGDWHFEFDSNGARTHKSTPSGAPLGQYDYDPFGRMTSATVGTVTKSMAYDHEGRKVRETKGGVTRRYFSRMAESEDGVLTKYYWLGSRLIAKQDVAAPEFSDTAGGIAGPSFLLPYEGHLLIASTIVLMVLLPAPVVFARRPRWDIRTRWVGAGAASLMLFVSLPISVACAVETPVKFYHFDRLESTVAISNYFGELEYHIRYKVYGEVRGRYDRFQNQITEAQTETRREFAGFESDFDTDLQYANTRYYDPATAQFLSHDPQSEFPSPYAYAGWDPITFVDPTGAILAFLAISLVLGNLIAALHMISTTRDAKFKEFAIAGAGGLGAVSAVNGEWETALKQWGQQALSTAASALSMLGGWPGAVLAVGIAVAQHMVFDTGPLPIAMATVGAVVAIGSAAAAYASKVATHQAVDLPETTVIGDEVATVEVDFAVTSFEEEIVPRSGTIDVKIRANTDGPGTASNGLRKNDYYLNGTVEVAFEVSETGAITAGTTGNHTLAAPPVDPGVGVGQSGATISAEWKILSTSTTAPDGSYVIVNIKAFVVTKVSVTGSVPFLPKWLPFTGTKTIQSTEILRGSGKTFVFQGTGTEV